MYRLTIIFVIFLSLLLGFENQTLASNIIPDDIKYKIINDSKLSDIKRSVDVVLNKKISKETLGLIAKNIKKSDSISYKRTFIQYFIEGKSKDNGYWATTHFNPNLEVKILGLSQDEELVLQAQTTYDPDRKLVGSWLDDRPYVGNKITIFYTDGILHLERIFHDGSLSSKEMTESQVKNGRKIVDKGGNDFGEYFILNQNNDLEFWSNNGNYYTTERIN